MIITLSGENSYGLQAELQSLMAKFVADHGDLALERLDAEDASMEQIEQALTSLPFLSSKKMVILRAPSKQKQFIEKAEQLLAELPESTDVIIVEPKLDKRQTYYKYLQTKTNFHHFLELDEGGLARWLVDQVAALQASITLADARYLVQRVGVNQQLLATDIQKLALYSSHISKETIDLLTDATPQSTIFQLLEAAFAGRKQRVLELYGEQRALKVEPQQIIAMLSWQLHILALVQAGSKQSAADIAKRAKLSPYVVQKSLTIATKLSRSTLKDLVADLASIDMRSKRTNLNLDDALQLYLLSL